MWNTRTVWFDIAVIMSIFAVGNILFGHFEEHRPKARRVLKMALFAGFAAAMNSVGQRWAIYAALAALAVAVLYIHAWWLPKNGVNGWTGEPRTRYYELLGMQTKPDDLDGPDR